MWWQLFNTNAFSGLATVLTGLGAFGLYKLKLRNDKIQAARVLLTEIRIAEERIQQIKEQIDSKSQNDFPTVFPSKNWNKYSHLFISDFDQDELRLLNSFYDYGELIEEYGQRNNRFFWITTEERAKVQVQQLANFIHKDIDQNSKTPIAQNKFNILNKGLDAFNYGYAPNKTINKITQHLSKIQLITTSSCGLKLKRIAKL